MVLPKSFSSNTTDMTDAITPQPSWMPLIEPILSHKVTKAGGCALPNTQCSIIYGPEVSFQCPFKTTEHRLTGTAGLFR